MPRRKHPVLTPADLALTGSRIRLSPEELGLMAKRLAKSPKPVEAARIKERLARGFYGI